MILLNFFRILKLPKRYQTAVQVDYEFLNLLCDLIYATTFVATLSVFSKFPFAFGKVWFLMEVTSWILNF